LRQRRVHIRQQVTAPQRIAQLQATEADLPTAQGVFVVKDHCDSARPLPYAAIPSSII